jgi:hypothetical protein
VRQSRARVESWHAALAVLLGCLVVAMPLSGSTSAGSELTAISLVVLALASALASAPRPLALLPRLAAGLPVTGQAAPPLLRTRKTDPTHHPLAPRAPGQA